MCHLGAGVTMATKERPKVCLSSSESLPDVFRHLVHRVPGRAPVCGRGPDGWGSADLLLQQQPDGGARGLAPNAGSSEPEAVGLEPAHLCFEI